MNADGAFMDLINWETQAYQYLIQGDYSKAANLYEQAIEAQPCVKSNYWYLGLLLLLQAQEVEAQTTWWLGMADGEPEEIEQWTTEIGQILRTEAERRELLGDYNVAWVIRQYLREISLDAINKDAINNLLMIIDLAIKLEKFTGEEITQLEIIQILQSEQEVALNQDLLLQVIKNILNTTPLEPSVPEFVEACLPYVTNAETFIDLLMAFARNLGYFEGHLDLAIRFAELSLCLDANNIETLRHLACFYQNSRKYEQGIETAKQCYLLAQKLTDKISANHMVIRGLMSAGGYWEKALSAFQHQLSLLSSLSEKEYIVIDRNSTLRLFTATFFQPYFRDSLKSNRLIQNRVAHICQSVIQIYAKEQVERYSKRPLPKQKGGASREVLKIGYISSCLRTHSVGWLARWLFKYHAHSKFQVHAYFVSYPSQTCDILQEWYAEQADIAHKMSGYSYDIAEQIYQDEIDILIDIDSITLDTTCEVMALKPAPVQVTWLGWDASGIPAIDYFIADPYVLPESAEDYYTEKIWRLPQTYVAVDGFEVGVPTLRRDNLDIPSDAVVYLTAQKGYKRHPHTTRLQMKIIKEVPNSYFLIKGLANQESIKNFVTQIAQEEGMDCSRLRFLEEVSSEAVHRANLGIADVVLDTYPYNGATTTLETLWMCIPLVTRVGEQFSARNSYGMMMNAGVTEGIAWTDEEYVEWGVRLGKDAALRQKISWQLRQSRQTAPLWNAKQFTKEMEKAYQQMWTNYLENNC
ncbi:MULTISPECIES: O-linked N-acetylglucosamine transferase, SPINDLY family protein [Cyanophyceae]|uniref:O-linked N-acetylglucosamine transferase, SPINDLY family protein n=1 Tax=Cyanophyceae TaxID=3028117 RepID=UPI00168794BC|nr:O-linked N-acetylglucosamine transferase, SPINDLY family protein [Trichocoleus sp. FACHB-69]MBD1934841.1 O-linked N-acetylglucosamine transferase, SPINDLY family protein [Trichocoleus sp. FACHB-69]